MTVPDLNQDCPETLTNRGKLARGELDTLLAPSSSPPSDPAGGSRDSMVRCGRCGEYHTTSGATAAGWHQDGRGQWFCPGGPGFGPNCEPAALSAAADDLITKLGVAGSNPAPA